MEQWAEDPPWCAQSAECHHCREMRHDAMGQGEKVCADLDDFLISQGQLR